MKNIYTHQNVLKTENSECNEHMKDETMIKSSLSIKQESSWLIS